MEGTMGLGIHGGGKAMAFHQLGKNGGTQVEECEGQKGGVEEEQHKQG